MEVPQRFYRSPAEGSQQLSEVVGVQFSLPSEAKPSNGFPLRSIFRGSDDCPAVYEPVCCETVTLPSTPTDPKCAKTAHYHQCPQLRLQWIKSRDCVVVLQLRTNPEVLFLKSSSVELWMSRIRRFSYCTETKRPCRMCRSYGPVCLFDPEPAAPKQAEKNSLSTGRNPVQGQAYMEGTILLKEEESGRRVGGKERIRRRTDTYIIKWQLSVEDFYCWKLLFSISDARPCVLWLNCFNDT